MQILVVCCIMSGRRQLVGCVYFKTVASSQMFHLLHLQNTFGPWQLNLLVGYLVKMRLSKDTVCRVCKVEELCLYNNNKLQSN